MKDRPRVLIVQDRTQERLVVGQLTHKLASPQATAGRPLPIWRPSASPVITFRRPSISL